MIILFPSEPFSPREVDSSFAGEYNTAKLLGFDVFLFDHDEYVRTGDVIKMNLPVKDENSNTPILLRSWMLKVLDYEYLYNRLLSYGYKLINNPTEYLNCHHFPEYYKHISEHTSKAWWSGTWSEHPYSKKGEETFWEPVRSMLGDIIIKDYVKSEKGNPDLFILKKELTNDEFNERVQQFVGARGKLFNKGIVFKAVENLKKYEGQTNEWRFFFLNKKLLICNQNSDTPTIVNAPSDDIIIEMKKIADTIESNFFTIDIAQKEDGGWMILELGDGQVSGLPLEGDALSFYGNMRKIITEVEV
jgi:hypothetical protein